LADKSSITFSHGFRITPPQIESITPTKARSLDEVSVTGKFFRTKNRKVLPENVLKGESKTNSCKVTGWGMDEKTGQGEITFMVPKGLSPGFIR